VGGDSRYIDSVARARPAIVGISGIEQLKQFAQLFARKLGG
jgi:hypothetical protein